MKFMFAALIIISRLINNLTMLRFAVRQYNPMMSKATEHAR